MPHTRPLQPHTPRQFGSAWDFAEAFNIGEHVDALLLRLPLAPPPPPPAHTPGSAASAPSAPALGFHTAGLEVVQAAVSGFARTAGRSLLFCRSLQVRLMLLV